MNIAERKIAPLMIFAGGSEPAAPNQYGEKLIAQMRFKDQLFHRN
jgi:hypothetical protein